MTTDTTVEILNVTKNGNNFRDDCNAKTHPHYHYARLAATFLARAAATNVLKSSIGFWANTSPVKTLR
jgi:hypothetical protein